MTLALFIVRHGESEGNKGRYFTGHGPSPLTALGLRQAEAVARLLAGQALDVLYSSDLPRALQTVAPLARATGLPVRERASLRERNLGDITGVPFDEAAVRHPEIWQALSSRAPDYRPPGGESHEDCGRRIATFLTELHETHPEGRIAIVSHGISINHLLQQLLGSAPGAALGYSFRIDNCSVQRVERSAQGFVKVIAVNDTAHLIP